MPNKIRDTLTIGGYLRHQRRQRQLAADIMARIGEPARPISNSDIWHAQQRMPAGVQLAAAARIGDCIAAIGIDPAPAAHAFGWYDRSCVVLLPDTPSVLEFYGAHTIPAVAIPLWLAADERITRASEQVNAAIAAYQMAIGVENV